MARTSCLAAIEDVEIGTSATFLGDAGAPVATVFTNLDVLRMRNLSPELLVYDIDGVEGERLDDCANSASSFRDTLSSYLPPRSNALGAGRDVATQISASHERLMTVDDIYVAATQMRVQFTAFALRYVASRADAEDVVQDFYLRVVRSAKGLRQREYLRSWFFRVLQSALKDHFRSEQRWRRFFDDADSLPLKPVIDEQADCDCLHDMLTMLRPGYAQMIQQIDLDEQSVEWTATLVGITANNARVRLFRARRNLRTMLLRRSATCRARKASECRVQSVERGRDGGRPCQVTTRWPSGSVPSY